MLASSASNRVPLTDLRLVGRQATTMTAATYERSTKQACLAFGIGERFAMACLSFTNPHP